MKRILIAFALAVQLFTRANAATMEVFVGSGFSGLVDGIGTQTMFQSPLSVAVDPAGNLFVSDQGGSVIRKVTASATVSTIATNLPRISQIAVSPSGKMFCVSSVGLHPFSQGQGLQAGITYPPGINFRVGEGHGRIAFGLEESLFITVTARIYRYSNAGVMSVFAGSGDLGTVDGSGIFSSFYYSGEIAAAPTGQLVVFEPYAVRSIIPDGIVSTMKNSGLTNSYLGDSIACAVFDSGGNLFVANAYGFGTVARFDPQFTRKESYSIQGRIEGIAVDASGNLYAADSTSNKVYRVRVPVTPAHVPQSPNLAVEMRAALTLTGETGYSYRIESAASANGPWKTEDTVTLRSSPQAWIDPAAAKGSKIYRAILLQ